MTKVFTKKNESKKHETRARARDATRANEG